MTLASTVLLASIPMLVHLYATRYREEDKKAAFPDNPADLNLPIAENFDFIVVGGGTAGCVVARRLAEQNYKVLLMEAGGNPPPLQSVPLLSVYENSLPEINYLYHSTPQKNAALKDGGILKTSAGKMLGGSSSHNDMMYERGHPLCYDGWANTTGDASWRYQNILQFFKKSENYMGRYSRATGQHGASGPWTVSRPEYGPGKEVYVEAGRELNLSLHDSNGPQEANSVAFNEFFKKKGRRQDTYTAFIKPVENDMKNLFVYRYSVAEQILIEDKTAKGVLYKRHGVPRVAFALKEIILSTGAYISPILLIKSGIGPEDQLKAANVTPVRISPGVGKNLQDHPFLPVGPIYVKDHSKAWYMQQNLTFDDFDTFLDKGDGVMTSSYTVGTAEAFIASTRAVRQDGHPNWPDLQIYYEFLGQEPNSVQCYVGFNRPYSRGEILLNTSATSMVDDNLPIVEYNYFTVDSDFDVVIEGIHYCLKAVENTTAFNNIGAEFTKNPIPECADVTFRSDEYWRCFIRQTVESTYHASGTCRMGKKDDPNAVVDSQLKVIGVKNLRVVDASIMPRVTNANTCAPTVMIAEKASYDIIKEYQKNTSTQRPRPPFPFPFPIPGFPNIFGDAPASEARAQ